jgi:hypothetical protein
VRGDQCWQIGSEAESLLDKAWLVMFRGEKNVGESVEISRLTTAETSLVRGSPRSPKSESACHAPAVRRRYRVVATLPCRTENYRVIQHSFDKAYVCYYTNISSNQQGAGSAAKSWFGARPSKGRALKVRCGRVTLRLPLSGVLSGEWMQVAGATKAHLRCCTGTPVER